MRAMFIRQHGPPEVFALTQVPDPQLASGQVLVRVKAMCVNFADLLQRMGLWPGTLKPPFIQGLEVSGIIEAMPSSLRTFASNLQNGSPVVALVTFDISTHCNI